ARAPAEAPADPVGGPDRRHLAVPAGAGQVGHDQPLPAPARRDGGADVRAPGAATGAPRDVRRDRLPRAGAPDPRRDGGLRPDLRRPRPPPPGSRGPAPGIPSRLPPAGDRTRRPRRRRRTDLHRGGRVREPTPPTGRPRAAPPPTSPNGPGPRWPSSRASGSARRTRRRSRSRRI